MSWKKQRIIKFVTRREEYYIVIKWDLKVTISIVIRKRKDWSIIIRTLKISHWSWVINLKYEFNEWWKGKKSIVEIKNS